MPPSIIYGDTGSGNSALSAQAVGATPPPPISFLSDGPVLYFDLSSINLQPEPDSGPDLDLVKAEGLDEIHADLGVQIDQTIADALQVHASTVASGEPLSMAKTAAETETDESSGAILQIYADANQWAGQQWEDTLRYVPPEAWQDSPSVPTPDTPSGPQEPEPGVPVLD